MDTTESDRAFAEWFAESYGYSADAEAIDGETAAWSAAVEWKGRQDADTLRALATEETAGEVIEALNDAADRLAAAPTPQPAKE